VEEVARIVGTLDLDQAVVVLAVVVLDFFVIVVLHEVDIAARWNQAPTLCPSRHLASIGPAHSNLTTVRQNTQQQAEHAVAAAVERLDEQCSAPLKWY
jgi:hypothetical protein